MDWRGEPPRVPIRLRCGFQSRGDGHHVGGAPDRDEINDTQEINFPAVMKAIVDTGFKGFVAQKFIPNREDKIASFKQGVQIRDV
ncbi:MAG TPA: hypothetical protein VNT99_10575 [Methylomirabilota bacterium]|nr:hypothetical protein [Methylomirabilota bacterium]